MLLQVYASHAAGKSSLIPTCKTHAGLFCLMLHRLCHAQQVSSQCLQHFRRNLKPWYQPMEFSLAALMQHCQSGQL